MTLGIFLYETLDSPAGCDQIQYGRNLFSGPIASATYFSLPEFDELLRCPFPPLYP
jgi:hypothetical protein